MSEGVRQRKGVEEVASKTGKPPTAWDKRLKKRPPSCWELYGKWFWRLIFLEFILFTIAVIVVMSMDSPIKPRTMELPTPRPLEGALAPNTVLQKAKKLFEGELIGPESMVLLDGKIYTGSSDGKILKIENDNKLTTIAQFGKEPCGTPQDEHTCGRPLGIHVSQHGTLHVMDAYLGLFEVNVTGEFTRIISSTRSYNGYPITFGNDVTRLPDGDFFFTDSDFRWQRRDLPYIVFEGSPNGRLMWFNPITGFSNVALFDLYFPNGIHLSENREFILICETSHYRIIKYHIAGNNAGTKEIFIDNLPGMPDQIRPSRSGGYWVGIHFASLRMGSYPISDFLGVRPMLRKQLLKIFNPGFLLQLAPKYGLVLELSKEGEIIRSLHDPTGEVINSVSEVLDTGSALYLGSYQSPFLAKLDYDALPEITE